MPHDFVGRLAETAAMTSLIEQAAGGDSMSVFVRGPSGSGKTSFLDRTIASAAGEGFRIIDVRVRGDGVPLDPLRLALVEAIVDDDEPESRRLAAALADDEGTPAAGRFAELLDALLARLQSWAGGQPVLLTIDDLDAADRGTISAVLFLVRHVRHSRVMIAATCCDERLGVEVAEHLRRLADGLWAEEIALGMFGDDDLAALVQARAGRTPHDLFVRMLRNRTGGLPYFAVMLLDVLLSAGVDPSSALVAARATELALPRRVSTAVLHRVFELGPDARLVASAASVLGVLSLERLALIGELTGLAPARANDAFDRLVRARVLVSDGERYRFDHSIVGEALYDDLSPAVRRAWHAGAAIGLAEGRSAACPEAILEIAGHLRRGSGGRDEAGAGLLREAGETVVYDDPASAAAWFEDALARLDPDSPDVAAVQLSLGHALDLGGRHDDAERVIVAALRSLPAGPERERGAAIAAHAALASGRFEVAETFLDAALRDATRSGDLLLDRSWVRFWQGRLVASAQDLADARSRGVGDAGSLADALEMHLCLQRGESRRGAAIADRLRSRLADLPVAVRSNVRTALHIADAFDLDPSVAASSVAVAAGARDASAAWHLAFAAHAYWRLGCFDDALRMAELAAASVGGEDADLVASTVLAVQLRVRTEVGDLAGAETVHQLALATRQLVMPVMVDCAVARLHDAHGQHELALTVLDEAVRRETEVGRVNVLSMCLAALVDSAVAAHRIDVARAANARLQALPDDGASVATTMCRTMSQAQAEGDLEAAWAARRHAVHHGLALDAARALRVIGELGDRPEELAAAHDELVALGAALHQNDLAALIRGRVGRKPPRRRRRVTFSTDELRIADLVAEGMTNRQIARRMNFSPKTIEVYLSRIYAKTGYRSRVELAVAVQRSQLPDPERSTDASR